MSKMEELQAEVESLRAQLREYEGLEEAAGAAFAASLRLSREVERLQGLNESLRAELQTAHLRLSQIKGPKVGLFMKMSTS